MRVPIDAVRGPFGGCRVGRGLRLVGTTGNPYRYAAQLAALPAPFRVVAGSELRHTTRALGQRLLAAAEEVS